MTAVIENLTPESICARLPHAGPVCQLEQVTLCDADRIVCLTEAHRRNDNPLRREGALSVHAGVEMAGQAMALHLALAGEDDAEGPREGMITRLNEVSWHRERLDTLEGQLTVTAECEAMAGQMARYRFSLDHQGVVVIEGKASVWLTAAG